MKTIKRIAAAAAAVCLAATGCSATVGNGTQKAMSVDGYDIGAGMLVYYTIQAYDNAVNMLSDQNEGTPELKDVKNSKIDEKDATDWIQDKATDECITFAAVEKMYEEIGGELSQENKDEAKQIAEYYYNMDSRAEDNGVSLETFNKIAEASYKQEDLFKHYFGIGGEKGCTDDELKDYFDENYARVKYITISLTDENGEKMSDDELREIRKMADEYARKINKKSDNMDKMWELDDCSKDYQEYVASRVTTTASEEESPETTTTAAETEPAETTTTDPHANERIFQKQTTAAESDSSDTETTAEPTESEKNYNNFLDFIFNDLELNKAEVYEYDKENLYVVIRGDLRERMTEDDLWTDDYKLNLLQARYYNDYTDFVKEYAASLPVEKNSAAYRRYAPFKLQLEKKS